MRRRTLRKEFLNKTYSELCELCVSVAMMNLDISHHRGAKDAERIVMNGHTAKIIGAAIEVHKVPGPGLLESAYEGCLAHELSLAKISFERKVPVSVT